MRRSVALAVRRMRVENERVPRLLREVEVLDEIAEDRRVLAYVWARVGPSVGSWIEPLSVQEVVLDELDVRVEAQRLVVDEASPCIGADHESGDAEPVAVFVDRRRRDMVVEAAPVVPRDEDRS